MRAYNMAMATIFFNAGLYVTNLLGMFGDMGGVNNSFMSIFTKFSEPLIKLPTKLPIIGNAELRGIDIIALALAVGTIVFLNSNAVNDRGVAYTAFAGVFWGSFGIASVSLSSIDLPGIDILYMIYFLASALIFVMALVQMPTGGQKSHV